MRKIALTVLLSLASLSVLIPGRTAWAATQVTVNPGTIAFGQVPSGTTVTIEVTFTNHGKSDLWFVGQAICPCPPGSPAYDFDDTFLNTDPTSCPYITLNNPPALPAGGSCATAITFSPSERQIYRAFLSMNFGTSDGFITDSIDVALVGKGS
jgi:hypothetical protein